MGRCVRRVPCESRVPCVCELLINNCIIEARRRWNHSGGRLWKLNDGQSDLGPGFHRSLPPERVADDFAHRVLFADLQKSARMKIPFGIAQIGKAFRNEIVARQFLFRMREFEQMEMQYFVKPGEELKWYEFWQMA